MCETNSFSHLTLEERRFILTGITNGSSKTAIAQTIGEDKPTVGKEIKLHRVLTHKCKMPIWITGQHWLIPVRALILLFREGKVIAETIAPLLKQGINLPETILGTEVFRKYVHVLLTDRGS